MKKMKRRIVALVCGIGLLCGNIVIAYSACDFWTVRTTCGTSHSFFACSEQYAAYLAHQYQLSDCGKSGTLIIVD